MDDPFIRWKGAIVPWVAQWTGELPTDQFTVMGPPFASVVQYPQELPGDRFMGVLWWRQGITRGGEPLFSQLNAYRQRAAMLHRRCQVCGQKLPEGAITHWLMGRGQIDVVPEPHGEALTLTTNPPTCESCVPIATKLCPHLRSGGVQLLTVRKYEPFGVQGETAEYDEEGQIVRATDVRMPFGFPALSTMVAKQLIVNLVDFDSRPNGKDD